MYFHHYDKIADRAKHTYARGTKLIADMQYRLGELAGTGRLDPEESKALQSNLIRIWEVGGVIQRYSGTTYAVRESVDYYDEFLAAGGDEADLENRYSDGREVLIQTSVESPQDCPYFVAGDGAVQEQRWGTISAIAEPPPDARDEAGR
jgi:hypothetical protein